ncbi:MAG: hypothetical protein M1814_003911 [Vezdaea aestivalis]|nr:MAG: hypothetical protein M1814_003911 [Vezdaea aestivalis]
MQAAKSKAEIQGQKAKLANSYSELLDEFSSKDLRNVGNYTLGRLIGKGSFGKVYLATHKLTNGSKAQEVVLKSAVKDDSNLAREIHHHRQFLHPHIARLYEVIVTESLVWLVLEYCPGDELYNYLLQSGSLPVEKAQRIFAQLVGAVSYVHGKSCVHRDLKLENILLDKHENVKLCDFGFTREYEGKASYLQTFCGTVCYSAPEMLKSEKYAGEKVDVWSLGVILYALLTGELPFDDDQDMITKRKILNEDPKWPNHLTEDSRHLLGLLLSKRPLLRPSLADILAHPFLSEHAPNQQAILKLHQPAPFTTRIEKDTLERMKSAGVDIDQVIENVLSQRCDALAGWWALLLEKEERKEKRRERKRKEKEGELKTLRRLSAASSRLERIAPTLKEVAEEGYEHYSPTSLDAPRSRGREKRRSAQGRKYQSIPLKTLKLKSRNSTNRLTQVTRALQGGVWFLNAPTADREGFAPPPKEYRRSRNSTLHVVSNNPELLSPSVIGKRRPRRNHQHPILNQLASLKHWFIDSAKRAKSPGSRTIPKSATHPSIPEKNALVSQKRSPEANGTMAASPARSPMTPTYSAGALRPPRVNTNTRKRSSLSPSPMTPPSSYRRSSGLRGRKSTSSSVSSIRSIHHHHTHSKASSTSSNSMTSAVSKTIAKSPRNSIKILPATPTATAFPSNIRLVRSGTPSGNAYNETMGFGLQNPALVFAKRKKSPFKGPVLNVSTSGPSSQREIGLSRNSSNAGRRSGEIIEEEDEDEIEEVEGFSPTGGPGDLEAGLEQAFQRARLDN